MPDTILDLAQHEQKPTVVVGKSMIDGPKSIEEQIAQRKTDYELEMAILEEGGDDRDGSQAWGSAMRRVGRK